MSVPQVADIGKRRGGRGAIKYRNEILQGDAFLTLQTLPDCCVDCAVTSPPYWGLRDYGVDGQIGLENTLDLYIDKMVQVFSEVKRVLKPTGTLWLNMGDGYVNHSMPGGGDPTIGKRNIGDSQYRPTIVNGLKPKDLIGQPWRLAFAMQADGWYLRSDIIWHKPNPMPESVTDRPTKAHEYLFLMSKEARYYYDAEAIKEPSIYPDDNRKSRSVKMPDGWDTNPGAHGSFHRNGRQKGQKRYPTDTIAGVRGGSATYPVRNKRTVWTIATQPYPEAHFATFPEKLVEPCILAGTSEKGNCAECGKPWVRMVEKANSPKRDVNSEYPGKQTLATQKYKHNYDGPTSITIGWQPSCTCGADIERPIVFDPFMGSGTVALVAKKLNRDFIGIELSSEYVNMANKRLREKVALFL